MPSFASYSAYYDLMYRDKRYDLECDFLEAAFRTARGPRVKQVLDLGCGTGGHALVLAERGYEVTGIDRAEGMLEIARTKAGSLSGVAPPVFRCGDLRSLELGSSFDAVVAMFAVISYLSTNEQIIEALRAVRRHLQPGGVFVFDAWHGPGVLRDLPSDRLKVVESEGGRVLRFAHTTTDHLSHTSDVHYHLLHLADNQVRSEFEEVHTMRFFFPQEITFMLQLCGFGVRRMCQLPDLDLPPRIDSWTFAVVAEAT